MEQFLNEVKEYADGLGCSPSTALQRTGLAGGAAWAGWSSYKTSPNMRTVDAIRAYMLANPIPVKDDEDAA